jgi:hypothetical protein
LSGVKQTCLIEFTPLQIIAGELVVASILETVF